MKFILSLLFIFQSLLFSYAQDSILLKNTLLPNKKYAMISKTITESKMSMHSEDLEVQKAIDSILLTEPMKIRSAIQVQAITHTKAAGQNVKYITDYIGYNASSEIPGNKIAKDSSLLGMKLYGTFIDEVNIIDSINLKHENVFLKQEDLQKMVKQFQHNLEFPAHYLKVGDHFNIDIPLSIPIPGVSESTLNIHCIYLLNSIEKNIAYFDIKMNITMDLGIEKNIFTIKGDGDGKMTYDIKNNLMKSFISKMDMNMRGQIEAEGVIINLNGEGKTFSEISMTVEG